MRGTLVGVIVSITLLYAHEQHHGLHGRPDRENVVSQVTDLHSDHTRASAVKATKRAAVEKTVRCHFHILSHHFILSVPLYQ